MRNGILMLMVVLWAAGCAKTEDEGTPTAEVKTEPSAAQTLVDGFTGRTAVRAGEKARATIEKVSQEKNEMLDEVLE